MSGKWWWLSFADASKPEGEQFNGVVVIRGTDFLSAVRNAHLFNINPGGQVRGQDIPDHVDIPEWAQKKLLTKEDCDRLDEEIRQQLQTKGILPNPGQWCVYMLICNDNSFYTGSTNDLMKRVNEHAKGDGAKYTRTRLPIQLYWHKVCADRSEAQKLEAKIKKLSHKEKADLLPPEE